jgi:hypothetical protein
LLKDRLSSKPFYPPRIHDKDNKSIDGDLYFLARGRIDEESNRDCKNEEQHREWIFHGTIVIPKANPFYDNENKLNKKITNEDNKDCLMLRPGLVIRLNQILVVNSKAVITHPEPANNFLKKHPKDLKTLTKHYLHLDINSFLCPGLIDLHIHAPQYTFAGTGTDRPLIGPSRWLQT